MEYICGKSIYIYKTGNEIKYFQKKKYFSIQNQQNYGDKYLKNDKKNRRTIEINKF